MAVLFPSEAARTKSCSALSANSKAPCPAKKRTKLVNHQNPSALSLELHCDVLHVRLNRPEVRNAMSQAMLSELLDALLDAEKTGVRVIVLRGSGGDLCTR